MSKNYKAMISVISLVLLLSACEKPMVAEVSYQSQIKPILAQHCFACHTAKGTGVVASGLSMESYESLMKGTRFGSVIKPGDSLSSTFVVLIEGRADPSINMPHGERKNLLAADITTIRAWINQGAKNN